MKYNHLFLVIPNEVEVKSIEIENFDFNKSPKTTSFGTFF